MTTVRLLPRRSPAQASAAEPHTNIACAVAGRLGSTHDDDRLAKTQALILITLVGGDRLD